MQSKEKLKKLGYELTADEEFKELGYTEPKETKRKIEYTLGKFNIILDLKDRYVTFWETDNVLVDINSHEIKAIYKKMKELGWLDE